MKRITVVLFFWVISSFSLAQSTQNIQFENGRWFTGKEFKSGTFYSVEGRLTRNKPARVDTSIDLRQMYVVPPFGDAHTHMLSSAYTANVADTLMKQGIFYAMVLNDAYKDAQKVMDRRVAEPGDYGQNSIGHFGFFKEKFRESLWEEVVNWMNSKNSTKNHP